MRIVRHYMLYCVLAPMLVGCSGFDVWDRDMSTGPTIADLEPVQLDQMDGSVPVLDLDALAEIYRDVLSYQDDPQTRLEILHRLADIEMLMGEETLAQGLADSINNRELLGPAIASYEKLLRENPEYQRRDTIAYQLSKAYDLQGDTKRSMATLQALRKTSPDSPYLAEASFRMAERQFAQGNYTESEQLYSQVVEFGEGTAFYTRGLYMLGWSRFKQDRFYDAIAPFTASLDAVLSGSLDEDILPRAQQQLPRSQQKLPRAQQELVDDSLRVLALSFSYLGGTDSIAQAYETLGVRPYQHLLYKALGALYLSQERYRDSAEVYQAYLEEFPTSALAHDFRLSAIAAYEEGGFPDLILEAKRGYVEQFAVSSSYWLDSQAAVRETIQPVLREYLEQLASHFHSLAQSDIAIKQKDTSGAQEVSEAALENYALAARYYREFIASFPQDPVVPQKSFLLAESLFEATDYSQALVAYEAMAYGYPDDPQAADAAYMGILSHSKMQTQDGEQTNPSTSRDNATAAASSEAIAAKLRFADTFVDDPRAVTVLGDAANQLFAAGDYKGAVEAAGELVSRSPQSDLTIAALLVMGHSQFALEKFQLAEAAYSKVLPLMSSADARLSDTRERVAASLYRQAEQLRNDDETRSAAALFERAMAAAPQSDIATTALYDAASAYQQEGDLEQANARFIEFRQRHPHHALSEGITPLLIGNYEQMKDWESAAGELDLLAGFSQESEQRRQSQLLAAQYYDKAAAADLAIDRYRSYAHNWPEPLTPRIEVIHRLTQLYGGESPASGYEDAGKVDFWLRKLEAAHAQAGVEQSERSAYLAANACTRLSQALFNGFEAVKLIQPIKQSLKRKREAMQGSLDAYARCSAYGVEEFTTLSNLRIGLTYQSFSNALMESQRPASLDALALEQYDMMLEEQAYPFEEKAIAVFESNVARCQTEGVYDQSVKESFAALASLVPARYRKLESTQTSVTNDDSAQRNRGKRNKLEKLNQQAIAKRETGDFDGAMAKYQKALSLADDDAVTHRNLGILMELYLGEAVSALKHYRRYQELTGGADRAVAGWIALLERQTVSVAKGM